MSANTHRQLDKAPRPGKLHGFSSPTDVSDVFEIENFVLAGGSRGVSERAPVTAQSHTAFHLSSSSSLTGTVLKLVHYPNGEP